MVIKKEDRKFLKEIQLLSGLSYENTLAFFIGFIDYITLCQAYKKPVAIPLIGELTLTYEGDIQKKSGKEALVSAAFNPSDFLKRLVGQIQDGTITDVELYQLKKLKSCLKKHIGQVDDRI